MLCGDQEPDETEELAWSVVYGKQLFVEKAREARMEEVNCMKEKGGPR